MMNPSIMGTYVLALWLARAQNIRVGRRETSFPAGWLLYAGSAMGPGGLRRRLARHRRRAAEGKRLHWHVDHIRERAAWGGAWARAGERRMECDWAGRLLCLSGARVVGRGLGASDCRCPAHLVHVPALPDEGWFAQALGAERWRLDSNETDELIQLLTTGDETSREAAAVALGGYGPAAIQTLEQILDVGEDLSSADARWWAARALAEVGGQGAITPLVRALADRDADVRACAALALGKIGAALPAVAAEALGAQLGDPSALVAGIAADALSMLGEAAVPALAEALADARPHVRLLAVRALDRTRSQSAVAPLCSVLEDSSYLVRTCAEEALDNLGVGMVYFRP